MAVLAVGVAAVRERLVSSGVVFAACGKASDARCE